MNAVKIPAFDEANVTVTRENKNSVVYFFKNSVKDSFDAYCEYLEKNGAEKRETFDRDGHVFSAYKNGNISHFLNYYDKINELYIVEETDSLYFEHENPLGVRACSPQITQIPLEEFGLSYVVRLSDGRFIIFDGGFPFEPDATKLFNYLKENSSGEKPKIAAWILTHPHVDHFECFVVFMELYGELVDIDALYYCFPEADDVEHFPEIDPPAKKNTARSYIYRLNDLIKRFSLIVFTPHTGQTYRIGDAKCEVLACMDDSVHISSAINYTSLVIRMEIGEQVILWGADSGFATVKLAKKHGEYLKSDILQIPHHGFGCGDPEGEIEAYDFIKPTVCLMPTDHYYGFITYAIHKKSTRHVMTMPTTKEVVVADTQRTFPLPYTPKEEAQSELQNKILTGIDASGSCVWVFSGLSTANKEDMCFDILNMVQRTDATVLIELFFTDRNGKIKDIRVEVPACVIKRVCLDADDLDSEWRYFNKFSLKKKGIPEDALFAVRFMSDVPVVVTNKNHSASYHTINR